MKRTNKLNAELKFSNDKINLEVNPHQNKLE